MDKTAIVLVSLLIVSFVLISGCTATSTPGTATPTPGPQIYGSLLGSEKVVGIHSIGGKYDASLVDVRRSTDQGDYVYQMIQYIKDGNKSFMSFDNYSNGAFPFIMENTPQDSVFLCWWDYGSSIIGYTGRDAVVSHPSPQIADTVGIYQQLTSDADRQKYIAEKCTESNDRIVDVAKALTTTDPGQTAAIMRKYGASYLFVDLQDIAKSSAMYTAQGEPPVDYNDLAGTVLARACTGSDIDGFTRVYGGNSYDPNYKVYIYKLNS